MKKVLVLVLMTLSTAGFSGDLVPKVKEKLTFMNDTRPILLNRCTGCHSSSSDLPDITEYKTAYDLRFNMRHKLKTKKMPYFGKMKASERDTVLLWIKQGAKK